MLYYRRDLPHWYPDNVPIFVTWRLAGTLPRPVPEVLYAPGKRFAMQDRELDVADAGPLWLRDPRIAAMVVKALHYGEEALKFYTLHAYVVMPNHVHVVWQPLVRMSRIMHWLKAATARRANAILGLNGAFWQEESYDHWIRSADEWRRIVRYVEWNPVKAGLAKSIEEWPWSSVKVVDLEAGRQQDCLPHSS
jgi:putative transposase